MPTYRVECHGDIREVYEVEAASPEEAMKNWSDGTLVSSEASTEPVSVRLADA